MARNISTVAVLGLGKVGALVTAVLAESGFQVVGYDAMPPEGLVAESLDVNDAVALRVALAGVDAVVSCLPYHRNVSVAEAAVAAGSHYFDLTEDVPTTQRIQELAAGGGSTVLAPQCGLAPGLIGIVGGWLAAEFETVHTMELRVGALPRNPSGLLGYNFNWSPEGVINEYLNGCEVLRDGERRIVPAMSEVERIVVGGIEFEGALTSGGLGTMCHTYQGQVQRLDYKTLRYPGHWRQMRFLLDELGLRADPELAVRLLTEAKPPVDEDVVHLYAAVQGTKAGQPHREDFVRTYLPMEIGGERWRAISWTTASSVAAVVELVADGVLSDRGFLKQEEIPLSALTATTAGRRFRDEGRI
jgi:saccharopine dehydrogenase-like NADP-dependent oxidoreductase